MPWDRLPGDADLAAINTNAMLLRGKPTYWFFSDGTINRKVGKDCLRLLGDADVAKVVPEYRRPKFPWLEGDKVANVAWIPTNPHPKPMDGAMAEGGRELLDGKLPLFAGPRLTMFFAIQVLAGLGYERMIVVASPLKTEDGVIHHGEGQARNSDLDWMQKVLGDDMLGGFRQLATAAHRRGIEMFSVGEGRLNEFLPQWSG